MKRILALTLIALLVPNMVWAAIGFDAFATSNTTGTSLTYSHTTAGSDRGLVVAVIGATSGTGDVITGVTYGGVAMTKIQILAPGASAGSDRYRYLFYLANPASGANNVVISASASTFMAGYSSSYTGTKQTGQPDSSNTGTAAAGSTNFSVSTTVVASNSWLVAFATNDVDNISAGTGTTDRSALAVARLSDSNGTVGTGAQSLAWTAGSTSGSWGALILSIAPVEVAVTATAAPQEIITFD